MIRFIQSKQCNDIRVWYKLSYYDSFKFYVNIDPHELNEIGNMLELFDKFRENTFLPPDRIIAIEYKDNIVSVDVSKDVERWMTSRL